MNILQLISTAGYYGAESMLLALARQLPELACGSIVGVLRDPQSAPSELERRTIGLGLRAEVVNCGGRWDWRTVRRIRELVELHEIDVLHTHGYKADLFGYLAALPERAALVATCHNWPSRQWNMRGYAALDRLVLGRFDRIATASEPVAELLTRWKVSPAKLKTIPNGVDIQPLRQPVASLRAELHAGSDKLVGFVGRLVPDKGGAVLLAAAQAVIALHPEVRFVFAGEGPARAEWERMAADLSLSDRVHFIGRRDDMPEVYASLDLVVLPSFQECMPMCLLEALGTERPVIATTVGAIPKVVIPGVSGLLVEPGDANALSSAILRLLRDPELARRMGCNGRDYVMRQFASDVVAKSYLALYQEALGEPRRPAELRPEWQRSRS